MQQQLPSPMCHDAVVENTLLVMSVTFSVRGALMFRFIAGVPPHMRV
jgi:hypothetical protein